MANEKIATIHNCNQQQLCLKYNLFGFLFNAFFFALFFWIVYVILSYMITYLSDLAGIAALFQISFLFDFPFEHVNFINNDFHVFIRAIFQNYHLNIGLNYINIFSIIFSIMVFFFSFYLIGWNQIKLRTQRSQDKIKLLKKYVNFKDSKISHKLNKIHFIPGNETKSYGFFRKDSNMKKFILYHELCHLTHRDSLLKNIIYNSKYFLVPYMIFTLLAIWGFIFLFFKVNFHDVIFVVSTFTGLLSSIYLSYWLIFYYNNILILYSHTKELLCDKIASLQSNCIIKLKETKSQYHPSASLREMYLKQVPEKYVDIKNLFIFLCIIPIILITGSSDIIFTLILLFLYLILLYEKIYIKIFYCSSFTHTYLIVLLLFLSSFSLKLLSLKVFKSLIPKNELPIFDILKSALQLNDYLNDNYIPEISIKILFLIIFFFTYQISIFLIERKQYGNTNQKNN